MFKLFILTMSYTIIIACQGEHSDNSKVKDLNENNTFKQERESNTKTENSSSSSDDSIKQDMNFTLIMPNEEYNIDSELELIVGLIDSAEQDASEVSLNLTGVGSFFGKFFKKNDYEIVKPNQNQVFIKPNEDVGKYIHQGKDYTTKLNFNNGRSLELNERGEFRLTTNNYFYGTWTGSQTTTIRPISLKRFSSRSYELSQDSVHVIKGNRPLYEEDLYNLPFMRSNSFHNINDWKVVKKGSTYYTFFDIRKRSDLRNVDRSLTKGSDGKKYVVETDVFGQIVGSRPLIRENQL